MGLQGNITNQMAQQFEPFEGDEDEEWEDGFGGGNDDEKLIRNSMIMEIARMS
jgi:hypothetical protein